MEVKTNLLTESKERFIGHKTLTYPHYTVIHKKKSNIKEKYYYYITYTKPDKSSGFHPTLL